MDMAGKSCQGESVCSSGKDPAVLSSLPPASHNWGPCLPWRLKPDGVSSAWRVRLGCIYLNHLGWLPVPFSQLLGGMGLGGGVRLGDKSLTQVFLIGARPRIREEGFPRPHAKLDFELGDFQHETALCRSLLILNIGMKATASSGLL